MDPLPFVLNLAGSLIAEKIAGDAVEKLWARVKARARDLFGRDPEPADFKHGSVFLNRAGEGILKEAERALGTTSAFRRAKLAGKVFQGARILWVDDKPKGNTYEAGIFRALGSEVDQVFTTGEAVARVKAGGYDLVLSNMVRDSNPDAGTELLSDVLRARPGTAVVFYILRLDPLKDRPIGSVGITNRPDELLHLALDVLEKEPHVMATRSSIMTPTGVKIGALVLFLISLALPYAVGPDIVEQPGMGIQTEGPGDTYIPEWLVGTWMILATGALTKWPRGPVALVVRGLELPSVTYSFFVIHFAANIFGTTGPGAVLGYSAMAVYLGGALWSNRDAYNAWRRAPAGA